MTTKFKPHITSITEGTKAPAFSGKDQNGEIIELKQFSGKKLVLYFYPEDNTPTCTIEACNLRDNYQLLLDAGFMVVGVSADNEKKHLKFINKYSLPFPLIADTEMEVIKAYDVWGQKQLFGRIYDGIVRTTFIISEKGVIEKVITKVESKNHADQILVGSEAAAGGHSTNKKNLKLST